MVRQSYALLCCALARVACSVYGQDDVSLLQHSVSSTGGSEIDLQRVMADSRIQEVLKKAPKVSELMTSAAPPASMKSMVAAGKKIGEGSRSALSKGWRAFYRKARHFADPTPSKLMHQMKMALVETGAMQEMGRLARAATNASRGIYLGAVPLDSMMVGFRTSVAPWNNILKLFKIPLIKSQFTIFTNFFGPDGNAARLCVGAATAVDSKYGVHAKTEFSGINIFIGPAKWDNIPGWSFGSSGGYDNLKIMDVADFGWTWTLAREPETVCFFYDLCIVDDEELHSNMLQTGSQVETADPQPPVNIATLERHGSTWLQHIWCSPDWFNTPLVLPDDSSSGTTMKEATEKDAKEAETPYFKAEEEWDPESEAV